MDEKTFQAWSETLSTLREKRHTTLNNFHRERGSTYTIKDFVDVVMGSLEEAVDKWWDFENHSREIAGQSEDAAVVTEEMISVVDFEVDAITRDLESFEGAKAWDEKSVADEMATLAKFSDELKRSYTLKIRSAFGSGKPAEGASPMETAPSSPGGFNPFPAAGASGPQTRVQQQSPKVRSAGGTGSRSSGVALFLMFILGLLLGSGPSVYFWDISQKAVSNNEDRVSQLSSEKRALEDNLGIYQQNLAQLASGKMMNLPQIAAAIRPIREEISSRRTKVDHDFSVKKESLMRRTQAGDLQDRSLATLQRNRDEASAALDAEEKTRLEPYLKQMQVLKELTEK